MYGRVVILYWCIWAWMCPVSASSKKSCRVNDQEARTVERTSFIGGLPQVYTGTLFFVYFTSPGSSERRRASFVAGLFRASHRHGRPRLRRMGAWACDIGRRRDTRLHALGSLTGVGRWGSRTPADPVFHNQA